MELSNVWCSELRRVLAAAPQVECARTPSVNRIQIFSVPSLLIGRVRLSPAHTELQHTRTSNISETWDFPPTLELHSVKIT